MKRLMLYRIVSLIAIFFVSTGMIGENTCIHNTNYNHIGLLYENVWGSIYHPIIGQCDSTATITADGSTIEPSTASEHRWIAISQDMLNDSLRATMVKYPERDLRFKGKIQFGDSVWIESLNPRIVGWWIVRDAKNARYTNSIDFLQTENDTSLYNGDTQWSGKFTDIKIYEHKPIDYKINSII